jgi:UDPglucose--hexose-1-phosphate uridylyltransferase
MSGTDDSDPRTVIEPTTGRPILMAPRRQGRPMHTGPQASAGVCPFCQGNEAETPPEVAAARDAASAPDGPGWDGRVFPNKYPANHHHEVIAEGRAHCEQPAELDLATWRQCIRLWQQRVAAIEARPGVGCTFLFKNVGSLAGASIAHNHSQILGLPELPPRLVLELQQHRRSGDCAWCRTLATARREQRLVLATASHAVVVPDPPKLPHETWLMPKNCDDDSATTDLESLATAMRGLFVAIAHGLGRPAFNLWLHRIPGERFHWHFELQPRTGQMAGLELGGDMYINALPARVSAQRLRRGLAAAGEGDGDSYDAGASGFAAGL